MVQIKFILGYVCIHIIIALWLAIYVQLLWCNFIEDVVPSRSPLSFTGPPPFLRPDLSQHNAANLQPLSKYSSQCALDLYLS